MTWQRGAPRARFVAAENQLERDRAFFDLAVKNRREPLTGRFASATVVPLYEADYGDLMGDQ